MAGQQRHIGNSNCNNPRKTKKYQKGSGKIFSFHTVIGWTSLNGTRKAWLECVFLFNFWKNGLQEHKHAHNDAMVRLKAKGIGDEERTKEITKLKKINKMPCYYHYHHSFVMTYFEILKNMNSTNSHTNTAFEHCLFCIKLRKLSTGHRKSLFSPHLHSWPNRIRSVNFSISLTARKRDIYDEWA